MSYVIAAPEYVAAAATDLANIGSAISDANAAAVLPTTGAFLPAGTDAVSTELAALFGAHAEAFQALSAQAAAFHDQFVQLMNLGSQSYAVTEAANVSAVQTEAVNVPQQTLGRSVLSDSVHAVPAAAVAAQTMAISSAAAAAPVSSAMAPAVTPVGSVGAAVAAGAVRPAGPAIRPASPAASPAQPVDIEETATVSALPAPLAARAVPAAALTPAPVARVQEAGEAAPASS
ncbi:PE family protein [Mycobacterium sp. TY814]|uniref:PE family protein n=1 Tax=unclassified Mycobacterium TaxID=2642494 RepID=UPI00274299C6|nr:PE family protein [Mycobacterium sp. TY814]MDP7722355.1 PE family protein [Mycobacterium sp. TY814]